MNKSHINGNPLSWAGLLDELKNHEFLSSDAKLAETLGVTRGYICSVKKGRKNISLDLAKTIFSKLGRTFDGEEFEKLFVPNKVRKYTSKISETHRNVILRANGKCQLCCKAAPFIDNNGLPYLEMHHIVPETEGGESIISNLIALCPNCHKKIKLCPTQKDQEKLKKIQSGYSLEP